MDNKRQEYIKYMIFHHNVIIELLEPLCYSSSAKEVHKYLTSSSYIDYSKEHSWGVTIKKLTDLLLNLNDRVVLIAQEYAIKASLNSPIDPKT